MTAADEDERKHRQQELAEVLETAKSSGTYAAICKVVAEHSAQRASELLHAAAQAMYYQHKNVRVCVGFARAGIHHALVEAARTEPADPAVASALRGAAKAIAYDLGSNLWPGWQDEGITLTAADLETGHEAAVLNLRLAERLERPALPRCNAHWLVGAHELVRDNPEAARTQFRLAGRQAELASKPEFVEMCRGYSTLAELLGPSAPATAAAEFDAAVQALRDLKTDDAAFFADQLGSVRRFFTERPK
jgi:hypothetical protein